MLALPLSFVVTLLGFHIALSNAQDITQCPRAETVYNAPNGLVYRTCTGTDYVGTSYRIVANTASAAACVQLCAQDVANACDKSVSWPLVASCWVDELQEPVIRTSSQAIADIPFPGIRQY